MGRFISNDRALNKPSVLSEAGFKALTERFEAADFEAEVIHVFAAIKMKYRSINLSAA